MTHHDAAAIADHLSIRPTVVVMNPPYSKSAGIGDDAFAGARHLRSALLALADGGRLVAVMPSWFAPGGSGAAGYAAVAKLVVPCADILCAGSVYAKHGTGIDVRVVVYDKGRCDPTIKLDAMSLDDLLPLLAHLPPRLPVAATTPCTIASRKGVKPSNSGLMRRATAPKPIAPRPPMLDLTGSDAREIAYTPRSVARPRRRPRSASTYRTASPASTSPPRANIRPRWSNRWRWHRSCRHRQPIARSFPASPPRRSPSPARDAVLCGPSVPARSAGSVHHR